MRAVITVVGKDTMGIVAKVSNFCADNGVNVMDVSQTILHDMFCMIMMVDASKMQLPFAEFSDNIKAYGEKEGLKIHVMHEDIFNSMHRI